MFTRKLGNAKFRLTFNSIIILLYFLYCSIPAFQFRIDARGNYMILVLILPYIVYYSFVRCCLRKTQVIIMGLSVLLVGVMYSVFTSHIHTPYPVLSNIIIFSKMLIPLAMYLVLRRKNDIAEINFTFAGMTIIIIYLLLQTISNSVLNDNIVHQIANMNYENFDNSAVAMSIDQSYALVPIACFLLTILIEKKKIFVRVLAGTGIAIIVMALFVAQYTSAILILLICVSVYMIKSQKGLAKIIVSLLLIVIFFSLSSLLMNLARNVDSENMSVRLTEVATFLQTGDMTGYNMSSRIELYKRGIVAFLKSPLWGNYDLGFNPHSSFIQFAADIGILGLLIFIYSLKHSKKRITYELKEKSIEYSIAYSSLIITGLINPIHGFPTMFFAVFCYVPVGIMLFNYKNR